MIKSRTLAIFLSFWSNQDYSVGCDVTMVYVGKNWLNVWNTLWTSEFPPMELVEKSEYQL